MTKSGFVTFLLAAFFSGFACIQEAAGQTAADQISMIARPPAKHGTNGLLLQFMPYDEVLDRSMSFIFDTLGTWFKGNPQTLLDESGIKRPVYFYYANLAMDGQVFSHAADGYVSYPAFHHAGFIQTFLRWYVYSGREDALKAAVDLADWNIAHSTPVEYPYGGMPYSTFNNGNAGGFVDGEAIMPDKAAIMALAYLKVFEYTGNRKYFDAANLIAVKLAENQLPEGNWPFRVNPKTREIKEGYTSSIIYAVKLFENLKRLGSLSDFDQNWRMAFDWLMNNPVRTGRWSGYYEDIPENDNRTNWDCIDVAHYLLDNKDKNSGFLKIANDLNHYVSDSIILNGEKFTTTNHPYPPAEGLREQRACFAVMGVHSAHWATLMARLALANKDAEYRRRAIQTMNFVTYHLQPDGRIVVGHDYPQYWFSCHIITGLFILQFLETFPEFAPEDENHILSFSSALNDIDFDGKMVSYRALKGGEEMLKIAFIPSRITCNGKRLGKSQWKYDAVGKLLRMAHNCAGLIVVE